MRQRLLSLLCERQSGASADREAALGSTHTHTTPYYMEMHTLDNWRFYTAIFLHPYAQQEFIYS